MRPGAPQGPHRTRIRRRPARCRRRPAGRPGGAAAGPCGLRARCLGGGLGLSCRGMDVGGTFVGRARELDLLGTRLDAARGGRGQLVLVTGEPGLGQTRLAEELGGRAGAVGVPLGWGRASEDEGSPPYWIFRQLARSTGRAMPGLLTGGAGGAGPAEARFEAFEALADDLRAAAEAQGLLLVLDDLQWADAASLALLVHLARGIGRSRLMIVATYRDTETTGREALSSALSALASESSLSRIRLVGL